MNPINCNMNSERAKKAQLSVLLDKKWIRNLLKLTIVASLLIWAWLWLLEGQSAAHLLLGLVGFALTINTWYSGELSKLRPISTLANCQDMSAVLDRKVLGRLPNNPTIDDLVLATAKLPGGFFYAARFAISNSLLKELLSRQTDLNLVWHNSLRAAESGGFDEVNSAALVAALINSMPDSERILASLQLDNDDIMTGLHWFAHITRVIDYHQRKKSYGGIGRDLSFGWSPLLNRVGSNITESIQSGGLIRRAIGDHDEVIKQVFHLLGQPGRRNAALVGEVGVGKTTMVYALAEQLIEGDTDAAKSLKYQQVIMLDAANLIANAKGRGQLEELLIRIFNEAIGAKNVILFLDEAQLFLHDGTGSVDMSSILLPVLEGGGLRIILSLSDQEWLKLSQNNPGLTQLLNRVIVKPLGEEGTLQVMEDQVLLLEGRNDVVYMYQSLKEAYKLADRFIQEQAFPGKGVKLLEAATGFAEQEHFITAQSVQQAVEKTFDVKVQNANTFEERDKLLNLEERIHGRMINQSRAVKLVSDALRRARAGVRNENRPIGTFLFLGPTGVGKTELSKSLADAYFGGEDRLVRVDLNEFSQPSDSSRLLAVGGQDPYSLCAQIAKQPFSVVLLDEIEKAHPNVLNILLQMLDEGFLRDAQNKPVSFRDSIIIATSNAGADKIRAHIDKGEALEQFDEAFVNELIDSNVFKPEFLNRFDEIVLFRPLTVEELIQVVDLLIAGLNKRLAAQKVSVQLSQEAKQLLAQTGYDPRLGARPLRRVVQRAVENIVAQKMLGNQVAPGQTMQIEANEIQQVLDQRS